MPRKKKEESGEETIDAVSETETTETSADESNAGENLANVEASADESNADETTPKKKTAKKAKVADETSVDANDAATDESSPSILDSVLETVTSVAGSVASVVSEGVSSVVSAVTGSSDETEAKAKTKSVRAEKIGVVASDKMTKTVTVRVDRVVKHPVYRKYIKRRKKFMAHDEFGAAIGDKVRIVETRPMSARKRWRVVEIIQKAEK